MLSIVKTSIVGVRTSGIEEAEDESLFDKLQNICATMKVTLNKSDIVSCHRVGKKGGINGKPRTVIVRSTREFRSKVFTNKKALHGKLEFEKIYFNEDLTTMRFKLLQLVKGLNKVKTVFTRDGKIHCNMKDNSKIVIENSDDLFKLGLDEVDYKSLGIVDLE